MKIINCEQRSETWFTSRFLHLTASKANVIIANGKQLETYCRELVTEFISDNREETYINEQMQRGIELEPVARQFANELYGVQYQEVGFCELNNRCGASPDGVLFDDNGNIKSIIEIKCPNNNRFVEQILNDKPFVEYIYQMQMQLLITGATECLYFAYNQNIKPYYFAKVIKPDAKIQEKLKIGIKHGGELIDKYLFEYYGKVKDNEIE